MKQYNQLVQMSIHNTLANEANNPHKNHTLEVLELYRYAPCNKNSYVGLNNEKQITPHFLSNTESSLHVHPNYDKEYRKDAHYWSHMMEFSVTPIVLSVLKVLMQNNNVSTKRNNNNK